MPRAFDYKSYWGDWWQASGFKRADSPNFNVVQDRYPLVPEQLQKVYDDTQVGLRREKAEAAASQVTYYNAEKWLYEKLSGAETAPPDLKTMMVADLLLEQQGLPYYIDWEAATRGPQGYNLAQIPLVQGRPQDLQSSAWRSGYLRMDEKLAGAGGQAGDRDALHLRGQDGHAVVAAPQAVAAGMALRRCRRAAGADGDVGGRRRRGSITVSQYEMLTSYRNLSRAAADSGLVVRPDLPVKLDNGMYQINYQLRPILENDPDWVRTGGDPYKAIQAVSENFVNMALKGLRQEQRRASGCRRRPA